MVVAAFLTSLLFAAAAPPVKLVSEADPLADYRWKNRVVLIFGDEMEGAVKAQHDALEADTSGVDDRDMVVLAVVGQIVSDGGSQGNLPTADALREQFGIAQQAPFTIVLVGKDGTEKLRETEPVATRDLFGLIDSMPMRRNEKRS